jgi:thiosulfate/3-mercaptopyruvate sulfurtransferase
MTRSFRRRMVLAVVLAVMPGLTAWGQSATTIPQDALVQPEMLHRQMLHPQKPMILQVGSRMMFEQAHIPGAEYVGPASRPEGLQALRALVTDLPRDRSIVLYCGCCPWDKCPNVAPAWELLHGMGFTHVQVLYIANNFGADWMAKGYGVDPRQ